MNKLNIIQTPAKNFKYYGVKRSGNLDSVEVHSIGCSQNTGMSIVGSMNQNSPTGIVHYVVDAEKENTVYQLLPETNTAWADGGIGNRNSITFEIAESDYMRYTGGCSFVVTDQAKFEADLKRGYNTAVLLVADICKRYGWDPTEKLPDGRHRVYSHNEGRLLGLSTAHFDPEHYISKMGLTMDKFRADVKSVMNGGAIEQLYRIRLSWSDSKSQIGAYSSLSEAKKACKPGYTIYDANGKVVYYASLYKKGKAYRMNISMSIRKEPKADAELLMYNEIPVLKRVFFKKGKNGEALIKRGVKDKCYDELAVGGRGVYMKITRGWILAQLSGEDRVTED